MRQTNINKEFRVYQLHINDTWVKNFQYGYYLIFLLFLYNLCKSFIYRHAHIRGRYIHCFQFFLVTLVPPDTVVFCISTHCFG